MQDHAGFGPDDTDIDNEVIRRIRENATDPLLDIAHHLPNNRVQIHQYTKRRLIEFGTTVLAKRRIYLDQNYWIYLRNAKFGRARDERHRTIYQILSSLVAKGVCVCPVSFSHWCETMRQDDKDSRIRTVQVMDELCSGVSIIPCLNLSDLEIINFLMGLVMDPAKLHLNEEMAWTYSGLVGGLFHVTDTCFDPITELAIQKMLFEFKRYFGLEDAMKLMNGARNRISVEDDEDFQRRQTEQCKKHRGDFKTLRECYLNEVHGCVDLHSQAIAHAVTRLYELKTGVKASDEARDYYKANTADFEKLIYGTFVFDRITTQLPCLDIPASLHAIKRYRNIPFKKGDSHDMAHVRTALPYCNAFFTERVMGQLICDSDIALDKKYQCEVLWNEDEILNYLNGVQ